MLKTILPSHSQAVKTVYTTLQDIRDSGTAWHRCGRVRGLAAQAAYENIANSNYRPPDYGHLDNIHTQIFTY